MTRNAEYCWGMQTIFVTRSDKTGLIAERICFQYGLNKFWGKLRLTRLHKDIPFPHRLAKFQRSSAL